MQNFDEKEILAFVGENIVLSKVDGEMAIKLIRVDVQTVEGHVHRAGSVDWVENHVGRAESVGWVEKNVGWADNVHCVKNHVDRAGSVRLVGEHEENES